MKNDISRVLLAREVFEFLQCCLGRFEILYIVFGGLMSRRRPLLF